MMTEKTIVNTSSEHYKRYLELLKHTLTDLHRVGMREYRPVLHHKNNLKLKLLLMLEKQLRRKNMYICRGVETEYKNRAEGRDWPLYADSMIGLKRLNNIEYCFNQIIKDNVEGDFIETGAWRGGATIFMKALLDANNIRDRKVWVADSFEGLPRPDEQKYKHDKGDRHYQHKELAISIDIVKSNFEKYGLLDDNVEFLKGWFKDTLPTAPIEKLALLRLDGDMYESTMDALNNLYHKVTPGGFVIIDDWGAVKACKEAVLDYRKEHDITEEIIEIDWSGVYWRKK